jgi:hypothetical protein
MATVNPIAPATPHVPLFDGDAASVLRHLSAARSILRTVALAAGAQTDGAVDFGDNAGAERWSAAVGAACERLRAVREILGESRGVVRLDYLTPLTLAEAIDAALWGAATGSAPGDGLDTDELVCASGAAIEAIDALLQECDGAGMAASH